jgi:hypothetical protein
MNGRLVFQVHKDESEISSFDFNLENGLYLLRIRGDKNIACSKLTIDQYILDRIHLLARVIVKEIQIPVTLTGTVFNS